MSSYVQSIITSTQLSLLLRGARKNMKLSQAQLAARLGLSQNRLSELERDAGTMSVEQLLAMCSQLGLVITLQERGAPATSVAGPPAEW